MAPRLRSTRLDDGDGQHDGVVSHNRLLAALSEVELAAVLEDSEQIPMELRQTIFEPNEPIERVFFPLSGMGSLVIVLDDGTTLESMTVGREGFIGLPLFHGLDTHRGKAFCQIPGEFLMLTTKSFTSIIEKSPELRAILHLYAQYSLEVISQWAACNSSHLLEQRLARWLLATADSIDTDEFNLTQEFISQMLAVRRAGVTVAMGKLERQGLIAQKYGAVTIIDRNGLKAASCECYGSLREMQAELLPT